MDRDFLDLKISSLYHLGVTEVIEIARRLKVREIRVRSGLRRQGIMVPRKLAKPRPPAQPVDLDKLRDVLAKTTLKDAAVELGRSRRQILRAAKKAGIRKKRGPVPRIDPDALAALVAEELSWSEIGRRLGCHATTAQRAWERLEATRQAGSSTCPSA